MSKTIPLPVLEDDERTQPEKSGWSEYLSHCGSHERPDRFFDFHEEIEDDGEFWRLVASVYQMAEISLPRVNEWLALFQSERPKRGHLMSPYERRALAAIRKKQGWIAVYRGVSEENHVKGISWTLSEKRADFFATYSVSSRRNYLCGFPAPAGDRVEVIVADGLVRPRAILAYFSRRKEREVIIDPKNVCCIGMRRIPMQRRLR